KRITRLGWVRYLADGFNMVHVLDFEGLADEMRHALTDRLRMVHTGAEGQLHKLRRQMTWKQFILAMRLHTAEEIATDGFGAYWTDSLRKIATKVGLRDYWSMIPSDGDFLGAVPSYTSIGDPLRRLCHQLIAFDIFRRGRAPDKVTATDLFYMRSMDEGMTVNVPYLLAHYLFIYAKGRKQGARMSGGHFVARLAKHFGLLTEEILQGLTVVVRDLIVIDMDELARLCICERLGDTWAWVAPGLERQQVAAAGAAQGHQKIPEGGVQADLVPVKVAQMP
ncbi:hypothetical protein Tco_0688446, partial [Tanacetum coccineum]